ncbi:MAG TPA: hypothetical protein VMZ00_09365 [Sporichthya sp.]|nr:hypothetical protein [Sporichthya sp.]
MSGSDDTKDGGRLFHFPRIVLPDSRDAPNATAEPGVEDDAPQAPAGVWPSLPHVSEMGPPLALTMPGIPDAGPDGSGDNEGAFAVPSPADPEHPTARDTLAVCMALLTALGVAAAQGMWHRARHRSALADQARATAEKATTKAAAARGGSKGSTGSESSLLRSLGSSGKKTRRSGGKHRPPRDAHSGSHHGPGRDKKGPSGRKPPKADRGGKTDWTGRDKRKRRKGGLGTDGACVQTQTPKKPDTKTPKTDASKKAKKAPKSSETPKKGPKKLRWKAPKRKDGGGGAKGWTSGRPGGSRKRKPDTGRPGKPRPDRLRWKADKRRPGSNNAAGGRKQWTRGGKAKPTVQRRKKSWTRRSRRTGVRWFKRWATAGATTPPTWPRTTMWRTSWKRGRGSAWRRWFARGRRGAASTGAWTYIDDDAPSPPRFDWMRPPPGADRRAWETAERFYPDAPPRQEEPEPAALAGAPAGRRLALGAAPTSTSAPAQTNGARFMSTPTTQYRDAELTIFDVADADADMAEEILAGVDDARATAQSCERLYSTLEELHAKVVELRVPGVLERLVLRLMEKTASVRARAISISVHLPAASEAISVAGTNAAVRHRPLADIARDMGHVRPAERQYHLD